MKKVTKFLLSCLLLAVSTSVFAEDRDAFLPEEYERLDYVSFEHAFDTGIRPNTQTKIEVDVYPNSEINYSGFFLGCRDTALLSNKSYDFYYNSLNKKLRLDWTGEFVQIGIDTLKTPIHIIADNLGVTINGQFFNNIATKCDINSSLCLFGHSSQKVIADYNEFYFGEVYIWQDGQTLTAHYIPVRNKITGISGLFDIVNELFVDARYGSCDFDSKLSDYIKSDYIHFGDGLLWATKNLGAKNICESGDYYVWGGTDVWYNKRPTAENEIIMFKDDTYHYDYVTYSNLGLTNIVDNLTDEQDAAFVKTGGKWRMASAGDIDTLLQRLDGFSWMNHKDSAYVAQNPNNMSVHFVLPRTGRLYLNKLGFISQSNPISQSWTRTADKNCMSFEHGGLLWPLTSNAYCGRTIRPISTISGKYSRTVTANNYGTICLAYPIDLAQAHEGVTYYSISSKEMDGDIVKRVYFTEETTKLEAGKPYIVLSENSTLTVSAATYGNLVYEAGSNNGLVGSYESASLASEYGKAYIFKNNKICKASAAATVGANKAWIDMDYVKNNVPNHTASAKGEIAFDVEGDITGIESVNITDGKPLNNARYNTSGQRVNGDYNGIVIEYGKKYIKK